jgi:hypothetical protein
MTASPTIEGTHWPDSRGMIGCSASSLPVSTPTVNLAKSLRSPLARARHQKTCRNNRTMSIVLYFVSLLTRLSKAVCYLARCEAVQTWHFDFCILWIAANSKALELSPQFGARSKQIFAPHVRYFNWRNNLAGPSPDAVQP